MMRRGSCSPRAPAGGGAGERAGPETPAARFASGPVTGTALPDMLARAA